MPLGGLELEAKQFIEKEGLTPENCYLLRAGKRFVLVTILKDGQELEWFDDREEEVQAETWRQLIAAGVNIRDN